MAISKLKTGKPFGNIADWLWQRSKTIIPNPLRPKKTKTQIEQKINATNLQQILVQTHGPNGKINKIIDEVNTLIQKVATLETKVASLETQVPTKSMIGHLHASGMGPTAPSTNRRGGKLQRGGRTAPVSTSRKELIRQIKKLQSSRVRQTGGRARTKPIPSSKKQLIHQIKSLQNNG